MQYQRSNRLLMISMGLILISFVSLIIWGYQKYYEPDLPDSNNSKNYIRLKDSTKTDNESLGSEEDAAADHSAAAVGNHPDSITAIREKMAEITTASANEAELLEARKKIKELNEKITAAENRNKAIEEENKRLQSAVKKISQPQQATVIAPAKEPIKNNERKKAPEPVISNRQAAITSVYLGAYYAEGNDEIKTKESGRAEKFSGNIVFRNAGDGGDNAANVYIVVYRPDGKLLNSGWETGTFTTAKGKMNYTTRLSFDCGPDETKKVHFNIYPDRFQKGRYSIYAYLNGKPAGTAFRTLQ